ncbi:MULTISPECIES: enoyl-CoA-hydratase DpgB [Streptomyces]|uniref:enoyl-CoA-hydratase DpgB n=1 Tax=Streptomyces TaxID=1883 RepID=UPI00163C4F68|nr:MULTISPECIES: enoyl-CoA-hydratase DpgB [Streptomyces]MBC2879034.1 enoyl-CoA hydratase/isomerase family protein [Streptomyces sp. TYQ1024]UBI36108.1 enoyl-CoA hydratase/isomerase family protein [Streptomyces mobaraensis]UKW28703.1 enoyl-CoA hydratase/isomerase family protein [Streptomyces sp. TYQ1024]
MTAIPQTDVVRLRLDLTAGIRELTRVLVECCERAERERAATVVVEAGEGTPAWPGDADVHAVNKWERALRRFERLDAVTVVAVSGTCGGPALEVLTAADVRLGGPDLRLALPVVNGGFWTGMALHRLGNRIGTSRTRRLVLARAGRGALTAAEAHGLDIVDEITDDVDAWCAAFTTAGTPVRDPRLLRSLVLDAVHTPFEEALGIHLAACDRTLRAAATTVAAEAPEAAAEATTASATA